MVFSGRLANSQVLGTKGTFSFDFESKGQEIHVRVALFEILLESSTCKLSSSRNQMILFTHVLKIGGMQAMFEVSLAGL